MPSFSERETRRVSQIMEPWKKMQSENRCKARRTIQDCSSLRAIFHVQNGRNCMTAIFPGTGRCYSWLSNLHLISWTRNESFVPQINEAPCSLLNLKFCSKTTHLVRPQHTTAFFLFQRTKNFDFHHRYFQFLEMFTLFYANIPREGVMFTLAAILNLARRGAGISLGHKFLGRLELSLSRARGKWRHKREIGFHDFD